MAKAKVSLKDELFNIETVTVMANAIKSVYSDFDQELFINETVDAFVNQELKERIHWISEMLLKYIPKTFPKTIDILLDSIKDLEIESSFAFSAYPDYIANNGCNIEHVDLALESLGEITKVFSAEFAIRYFINEFPEKSYNKMYEWSLSDNVHQRRLASEGLRPKLPWAKGINYDYTLGCLPLNNLYYDNVRYVTRSVANHLNDISKIDPLLVVSILSRWKKSKKQNDKEMEYIISHSLRTLVKKGHKETLEFLGYNYSPKVKVSNLKIKNPNINIGESIEFSFDIEAFEDELLVIDYKVIYPMANNKKSTKVFKIKKILLKENSKVVINKKQTFRVMTTKKLYSGEYKLIIQINGQVFNEEVFKITV